MEHRRGEEGPSWKTDSRSEMGISLQSRLESTDSARSSGKAMKSTRCSSGDERVDHVVEEDTKFVGKVFVGCSDITF